MKHGPNGLSTKDLISLSLYSLLLRKEYDEISITDICKKARISRMTFYRYYDRKDDIFINYCDERFEEFFEEMQKINNLDSNDFFLLLFIFFKKYYRQLIILRKAHKQMILLKQFNSYASYILSRMKSTSQRFNFSNKVTVSYLAGGLLNVLMDWISSGLKESPEFMRDSLIAIFTNK